MAREDKDGYFQVTNYINPRITMNTEYGLISGRCWVENERIRIGAKQTQIREIHDKKDPKNGFVALWRKV